MSSKKKKTLEPILPVKEEPWLRVLYPSCIVMAMLVVFFLAFFPVRSDDIFMYLAIGRLFTRTGSFPVIDPFLFTLPNYYWSIMYEWGSHIVSFKLFSLGGWNALVIAKTAIILLAVSVSFFLAKRLSFKSPIVPILVLLASFAACSRFIERSSLFSDLFTAMVLAIVLVERNKPGWLKYLLPLIFLVWVNMHPGFHIGLIILALAVLFDIKRLKERSVQIFSGCALASVFSGLVNPKGLEGFSFPLRSVFDTSWDIHRQYNFEWMPTLSSSYASTLDVKVFLLLIAVCACLVILAWKQKPWFELIILIFLVYLGLSAIRFMPTAALSLAVLGTALGAKAKMLWYLSPQKSIRKTAFWLTVLMILISFTLMLKLAFAGYSTFSGPRHFGTGMDTDFQPVQAADFLEKIKLRTPLFNQHDFGCYLAWRWNGNPKLFYHGFVDDIKFYHDDYLGVNRSLEEFDRIVAKYRIGAFLLARYNIRSLDLPLIYRTLLTRPDWHLVYVDDIAMVFLKDLPENQEAIQRYKIFP